MPNSPLQIGCTKRFDDEGVQSPLKNYLDDRGIPTRVTYDPTHLTEFYRAEYGYSEEDFPVTEDVSGKILTLPFHMDLDKDDLDRMVSEVENFFTNEY